MKYPQRGSGGMIGSKTDEVERFWQKCRRDHAIDAADCHACSLADPAILDPSVETLDLSDHPALINARRKNGTAHLAIDFQRNGVKRRRPGDYWVILSPMGEIWCLVRIASVTEYSFNRVPQEWAEVEGEGDISLRWWRDAHRAYYQKQCDLWGIEWSEDYLVVCESWDLVEAAS
jgi:uncharacterized protein YhfF